MLRGVANSKKKCPEEVVIHITLINYKCTIMYFRSARMFFRNIPNSVSVDDIANYIGSEFDGEFYVFKNHEKHVVHVVFKDWDMAQVLIDRCVFQ